jgi:hypothetical protein
LKTLHLAPVRLVLPAVLLVVGASAAAAQQPATAVPQEQQKEHVVRRGDTLWDLARAYLQNPFLWRVIYEANRDVVEDPHWIYPLERLVIPPHMRQQLAAQPQGQPLATAEPIGIPHRPDDDLAYLPVMEPVEPEEEQQPTVLRTVETRRPVVTAHEYLSAPWVSATPTAQTTGRIAEKTDPAARGGRMVPTLMPQERVNVVMTAASPAPGDSLLVVRVGSRLGQLGSIVQPTALLRVEAVAGSVVTGRVLTQYSDARVGDLVMPLPAVPELPFGVAAATTESVAGQLLRFMERGNLHGMTDLAFLSVGRAQGIGIGDELSVYVPAGDVSPAVQVAVVRVVRADDGTSTVRVVNASSTALREGLPVSLLRKMP